MLKSGAHRTHPASVYAYRRKTVKKTSRRASTTQDKHKEAHADINRRRGATGDCAWPCPALRGVSNQVSRNHAAYERPARVEIDRRRFVVGFGRWFWLVTSSCSRSSTAK